MKNLLSKNILRQSVRNSWKLWTTLTAVMALVILMITVVVTGPSPEMAAARPEFSMLGILTNGFYEGMGMFVVLMFLIVVGNRLVASEVDRGTMSFTLNTPTTRKQIIFSKALYFIVSVFGMVLIIGLLATIGILARGLDVDMGKFLLVNLGFLLCMFAVSGVCFLASCWFNKSGYSLMVGAGVSLAFYFLKSLSNISKDFEFLKYLSINTLFHADGIIAGTETTFIIIGMVALFAIGIVLYAIGINKFLKKDLPL